MFELAAQPPAVLASPTHIPYPPPSSPSVTSPTPRPTCEARQTDRQDRQDTLPSPHLLQTAPPPYITSRMRPRGSPSLNLLSPFLRSVISVPSIASLLLFLLYTSLYICLSCFRVSPPPPQKEKRHIGLTAYYHTRITAPPGTSHQYHHIPLQYKRTLDTPATAPL